MIANDLDLTLRLERASLRMAASYARNSSFNGERSNEFIPLAGGLIVFNSAFPTWSKAIGVGLEGPVTLDDVDRLEAEFRARDLPGRIYISPATDGALVEELERRGWRPLEETSQLLRSLDTEEVFGEASSDVEIYEVNRSGIGVWASVIAAGFTAPRAPEQGEIAQHLGFARLQEVQCTLALAGGEIAGAASLAIDDDLAVILAASTLPAYRKRGVHSELIRNRLHTAADRGCSYAAYGCDPDSDSQRNAERFGFSFAYKRLTYGRDWD